MAHALELEAVDLFRCPTCDAPKGIACKTPGGSVKAPHERRLELAARRRIELDKLRKWEGRPRDRVSH
jgi:hypothetical protein